MMVVAVDFQTGATDQLGEGADTGGLLAINDDQAANTGEIKLFNTDQRREQVGMAGTEITQVFFL